MAFQSSYDSTKLGNLLSVVEEIRGLQEPSDDIQLPDIVVCGNQSAGKSSVLQALAGVNLPRGKDITTRIALRLSLIRDPEVLDGQSYALIGKYPTLDETGERVEEDNLGGLGEKIDELTTNLAGPDNGINSEEVIHLKVVRNHGPTLTLVDLPGISHTDERTHLLSVECFRKRFTDPENRHIILLVLSAAADFESYSSLTAARGVDEHGERTICVLTNVDRLYESDLRNTVKRIGEKARAGVFPVYNPDNSNLTPTEARQEEANFFAELAPEHGLADGEWGIDSLGLHLMEAHTPIVEAAVNKLGGRISASLFEQRKSLSEMKQILGKTEYLQPKGIILTTINRVQREFERRATASSAMVDANLNVARRTELLYEEFRKNVRGIAPHWLSDDFKPDVEKSIQEHGGGDVRGQVVNAEYTVFRTAFSGKLEGECTALVGNVRRCVKGVLDNLLRSQEGVERPELPAYLCQIVDAYLQKKHAKAEEIVNYLAKAELMKRFTQDESYKRIILKVENLAEQMSVRRQRAPFPENNTDVPVEQVVDSGTDDDVDGIPMAFIKDYYYRVQEQFKTDPDVDVAKSQVSLHAYSKVMTRRVIDVVPMQAHLLLVTEVFDLSVRPGHAAGSDLVSGVLLAIEGESAEKLKRVSSVDPNMEAKMGDLSTDIKRLEAIGNKINRAISPGVTA